MAENVKVWFDLEEDFLEVPFTIAIHNKYLSKRSSDETLPSPTSKVTSRVTS